MTTITIRTDEHTDVILEKLEGEHSSWGITKSTIIKAAIWAFEKMSVKDRLNYLHEVRSKDGRRGKRYYW